MESMPTLTSANPMVACSPFCGDCWLCLYGSCSGSSCGTWLATTCALFAPETSCTQPGGPSCKNKSTAFLSHMYAIKIYTLFLQQMDAMGDTYLGSKICLNSSGVQACCMNSLSVMVLVIHSIMPTRGVRGITCNTHTYLVMTNRLVP